MFQLGIGKQALKLILGQALRLLKIAIIIGAVASLGLLIGGNGLTQKHKQEEKRSLLQKENERLHLEIKSLEREVTLLRENPKTIEKVAKRKLGMARPDETVFIFEPGFTTPMRVKDAGLNLEKSQSLP
ncbi:MAG: septum formation initiator family protein [Desulfomonile sp.]